MSNRVPDMEQLVVLRMVLNSLGRHMMAQLDEWGYDTMEIAGGMTEIANECFDWLTKQAQERLGTEEGEHSIAAVMTMVSGMAWTTVSSSLLTEELSDVIGVLADAYANQLDDEDEDGDVIVDLDDIPDEGLAN